MNKEEIDDLVVQTYAAGLRINSNGGWHSSSEADAMMDMLISDCWGNENYCKSSDKLKQGEVVYDVGYLADNLPAVQYVTQFYLEMIIHGGILTDNESSQKILDEWLNRRNILGQSNGNVIRQALLSSVTYGYSGLRRIGDDLVYIAPNQFHIWKLPAFMQNQLVPGVWTPEFYEVYSTAKTPIDRTKALKEEDNKSQFIKNLELHKAVDGSYYTGDSAMNADDIFVPKELFCHLRHSDEGDYGISPLTKDRLRTTLIVDYLRNVDDEVNNDGNDYMMYLQRRSNVGNSLSSLLSNSAANATINAAIDSKQKTNADESQMGAARVLAKKMKRSAKTRINLINQNLVERVERMEGTVQLNQYLSILNNAKGVIADIYGIGALLAGSSGGGWSTGMSAMIDLTLERTIKPFQQRYAEQLSPMIKSCTGIKPDVHFKEISWSDEKTREEIKKIAAERERAHEQALLYRAQAKAATIGDASTTTEK